MVMEGEEVTDLQEGLVSISYSLSSYLVLFLLTLLVCVCVHSWWNGWWRMRLIALCTRLCTVLRNQVWDMWHFFQLQKTEYFESCI